MTKITVAEKLRLWRPNLLLRWLHRPLYFLASGFSGRDVSSCRIRTNDETINNAEEKNIAMRRKVFLVEQNRELGNLLGPKVVTKNTHSCCSWRSCRYPFVESMFEIQKFEVQDRKLVEGKKCRCGCPELKEVVDHRRLTSGSGDHVRRPM